MILKSIEEMLAQLAGSLTPVSCSKLNAMLTDK